MNPEIGAEWVRRLRSGEYRQGKTRLRSDAGYCCLGVLCEMGVEAGVLVRIESPREVSPGETRTEYRYGTPGQRDSAAHILPEGAAAWAGLGKLNPQVPAEGSGFEDLAEDLGIFGDTTRISLSLINDNGGNFDQIANLIETHLLNSEDPA